MSLDPAIVEEIRSNLASCLADIRHMKAACDRIINYQPPRVSKAPISYRSLLASIAPDDEDEQSPISYTDLDPQLQIAYVDARQLDDEDTQVLAANCVSNHDDGISVLSSPLDTQLATDNVHNGSALVHESEVSALQWEWSSLLYKSSIIVNHVHILLAFKGGTCKVVTIRYLDSCLLESSKKPSLTNVSSALPKLLFSDCSSATGFPKKFVATVLSNLHSENNGDLFKDRVQLSIPTEIGYVIKPRFWILHKYSVILVLHHPPISIWFFAPGNCCSLSTESRLLIVQGFRPSLLFFYFYDMVNHSGLQLLVIVQEGCDSYIPSFGIVLGQVIPNCGYWPVVFPETYKHLYAPFSWLEHGLAAILYLWSFDPGTLRHVRSCMLHSHLISSQLGRPIARTITANQVLDIAMEPFAIYSWALARHFEACQLMLRQPQTVTTSISINQGYGTTLTVSWQKVVKSENYRTGDLMRCLSMRVTNCIAPTEHRHDMSSMFYLILKSQGLQHLQSIVFLESLPPERGFKSTIFEITVQEAKFIEWWECDEILNKPTLLTLTRWMTNQLLPTVACVFFTSLSKNFSAGMFGWDKLGVLLACRWCLFQPSARASLGLTTTECVQRIVVVCDILVRVYVLEVLLRLFAFKGGTYLTVLGRVSAELQRVIIRLDNCNHDAVTMEASAVKFVGGKNLFVGYIDETETTLTYLESFTGSVASVDVPIAWKIHVRSRDSRSQYALFMNGLTMGTIFFPAITDYSSIFSSLLVPNTTASVCLLNEHDLSSSRGASISIPKSIYVHLSNLIGCTCIVKDALFLEKRVYTGSLFDTVARISLGKSSVPEKGTIEVVIGTANEEYLSIVRVQDLETSGYGSRLICCLKTKQRKFFWESRTRNVRHVYCLVQGIGYTVSGRFIGSYVCSLSGRFIVSHVRHVMMLECWWYEFQFSTSWVQILVREHHDRYLHVVWCVESLIAAVAGSSVEDTSMDSLRNCFSSTYMGRYSTEFVLLAHMFQRYVWVMATKMQQFCYFLFTQMEAIRFSVIYSSCCYLTKSCSSSSSPSLHSMSSAGAKKYVLCLQHQFMSAISLNITAFSSARGFTRSSMEHHRFIHALNCQVLMVDLMILRASNNNYPAHGLTFWRLLLYELILEKVLPANEFSYLFIAAWFSEFLDLGIDSFVINTWFSSYTDWLWKMLPIFSLTKVLFFAHSRLHDSSWTTWCFDPRIVWMPKILDSEDFSSPLGSVLHILLLALSWSRATVCVQQDTMVHSLSRIAWVSAHELYGSIESFHSLGNMLVVSWCIAWTWVFFWVGMTVTRISVAPTLWKIAWVLRCHNSRAFHDIHENYRMLVLCT